MGNRSSRRAFRLLCLIALPLLLLGCTASKGDPAEEFRIGLMEPLNSPDRIMGHRLAEARVAELNAEGGVEIAGRKVRLRLVVEDSGGTTEQTMSVMSHLVQQERVSAIIGPYHSRDAIPVAAALEVLRVPMLTPSATNPEVTRGHTFAFRVCQLDSDQGRSLAHYAYDDLKLRKAAVLYDEADPYSTGLAGYFRESFSQLAGASLTMMTYQSGSRDFSAQLGRIVASGAQVLLLPNFQPDLAAQIQQARAAGYAGLFLGGDSWDTDHGFHSLPEAQGAVYSTEFVPAAAEQKRLAEVEAMAAKSGAPLSKNTALTLDAVDLLVAAAKRAGSTDPVSLRSGLATLTDFDGLTGRISYSGGGDPARSTFIVGITGGRPVLRARLTSSKR
ncbi:ABC transporter substrate-binding protein [Humidesulfovibrio sp.]|uniref:ABC transporter substrate-binding protein n=1 Tax=Humidesulfovibrio sp. TaxID=2910988 RepID=UPI002D800157|nr:ABC transporter substrate-binding protein [Humidesulfovibrio sp.]